MIEISTGAEGEGLTRGEFLRYLLVLFGGLKFNYIRQGGSQADLGSILSNESEQAIEDPETLRAYLFETLLKESEVDSLDGEIISDTYNSLISGFYINSDSYLSQVFGGIRAGNNYDTSVDELKEFNLTSTQESSITNKIHIFQKHIKENLEEGENNIQEKFIAYGAAYLQLVGQIINLLNPQMMDAPLSQIIEDGDNYLPPYSADNSGVELTLNSILFQLDEMLKNGDITFLNGSPSYGHTNSNESIFFGKYICYALSLPLSEGSSYEHNDIMNNSPIRRVQMMASKLIHEFIHILQTRSVVESVESLTNLDQTDIVAGELSERIFSLIDETDFEVLKSELDEMIETYGRNGVYNTLTTMLREVKYNHRDQDAMNILNEFSSLYEFPPVEFWPNLIQALFDGFANTFDLSYEDIGQFSIQTSTLHARLWEKMLEIFKGLPDQSSPINVEQLMSS